MNAAEIDSPPAVVDDLRAAADRVADAEAAIDDHGEASVEAAADAYRNATRLLDSYEDSATGTGDFGAYLQFQTEILELVDSLPDDTVAADAFQRVSDQLDKRRLTESDFAFAREQINTAEEAVEMLEEREAAIAAYREARGDADARLAELRAEADRLRELQELTDLDLEASIEPLRERTTAYNMAVRTAFKRFRTTQPARVLFDLLTDAADRPLVGVDRPPRDLVAYIESASAGTEPLATLVEYADYSPSKLDHYVDDPGALRTNVAVHQTYLDRLDAESFCVTWPPAEAATLRARLDELAPFVRRLDSAFEAATDDEAVTEVDSDESPDTPELPADLPASDPIEAARRRLTRFTRRDTYDRLHEVAVATHELDDDEYDRVAAGTVTDDLTAVTDAISEIEAALDETAIE
jgi:hypothetical protein